ncbi:MAG TPA: outer membrane beta-barrel protein [Candidatus Polarisedimenticolia bacterium]|jgi:outer membrane protein W
MKASCPLIITLAALVAGPAFASDHPSFKVFGAASYVSPLSEEDVDFGTVRDSVKASDELGWNVGFEVRFNRLIGLELDYINATNDIEFGGEVIGEVKMQPLSATLNFHVIPTRVVDLYLGPTASYFVWGDTHIDSLGDLNSDNELAYGASVGLEIGFGKVFALLGGVRWLKVDLSPDTIEPIAVNPLFSRLGVAFRF